MNDCIFCQIAKKVIPKEFTYESQDVIVFPDIRPVAPLHLLIVPKKHITDFLDLGRKEEKIWEEMMTVAKKLIKENNLAGYRLVLNGGQAKLIDHLHLHLIGHISAKREL